MNKVLLVMLILATAGAATANEPGEKSVKTTAVLSSVLPGAGQFYLGNMGKGFLALGGELGWWAGAGLFLLGGHMAGQEARRDPTADSLKTLETVAYVCSGLFGALALGWRTIMVYEAHDDAVAHNYRRRFLEFHAELKPEMDGMKLGLYRRF